VRPGNAGWKGRHGGLKAHSTGEYRSITKVSIALLSFPYHTPVIHLEGDYGLYTLIRYSFGAIVEGVVLKMQRDHMRVAAAGFVDALELRRFNAQWFTDSGQRVELEFLLSDAPEAEAESVSAPAPALVACAAASSAI